MENRGLDSPLHPPVGCAAFSGFSAGTKGLAKISLADGTSSVPDNPEATLEDTDMKRQISKSKTKTDRKRGKTNKLKSKLKAKHRKQRARVSR